VALEQAATVEVVAALVTPAPVTAATAEIAAAVMQQQQQQQQEVQGMAAMAVAALAQAVPVALGVPLAVLQLVQSVTLLQVVHYSNSDCQALLLAALALHVHPSQLQCQS
jgi:hypothetical protein